MKTGIESFLVTAAEQGGRLDKFLTARRPDLSRAFVQSLIADGHARVGGKLRKANYAVKTGDAITLETPPPQAGAVGAEVIALDILHEDDALIVINKPAGMVVHPAAGHTSGTLVNALLAYRPEIVTGNHERPGIVHRLDRDTSGVMLVAKTDQALAALQRQFAGHQVKKTYLALVQGVVKTLQGRIEAPLARDPRERKKIEVTMGARARQAVTLFRVLAHSDSSAHADEYSLLSVQPETGRTHQIRVHLAFLKHPVVGDALYGKQRNNLGLERQFLHAWRIEFTHPITQERMTFTAPLPGDLRDALTRAQIDVQTVLV